jgi:mannose-1-phosphate guanylyltransferase
MKQLKNSMKIKAILLAAGEGTRLRPYTYYWPKCLMPIQGRPILEYWLLMLWNAGIKDILVNTSYLSNEVQKFLDRPCFNGWVKGVYEPKLLGTAGTLRENYNKLKEADNIFVAHADNWTICDIDKFINYHLIKKPIHCPITMMTFNTSFPEDCGITKIDQCNILLEFHEKKIGNYGNKANAAIYMFEKQVLNEIYINNSICDISTQLIQKYLSKIVTWHNDGIHRDIGVIESLRLAQNDLNEFKYHNLDGLDILNDDWSKNFKNNPIHKLIL